MKNKSLVIIWILFLNFQGLNAQEFLVQNNEHLIYFEIIEDEIIFTMEDLKDNENNILAVGGTGGRNVFCGKVPEEKRNWNNDTYYFNNNQQDEAWAEFDVYHNGTFSYGFGRGNWVSSKYNSSPHPVWTFEQPISNFLKTEDFAISVRFFISRVAKNQLKSIEYKTYYYPDQECKYGEHSSTSNETYSIDLSDRGFSVINEMREQFAKKKEEKKLATLISETYNNLVTCEAYNNATMDSPEFSGIFVKLKDGKYIEVPDQNMTYGMPHYGDDSPSESTVRKNIVPFYTEDDFEKLGIVKIKKEDIVTFIVNPTGGELKQNLSLLSLHHIKRVELAPITKCRIFTYPNYSKISNKPVFYFDKTLINMDKFEIGIKAGLYGFWINDVVWIFDIID